MSTSMQQQQNLPDSQKQNKQKHQQFLLHIQGLRTVAIFGVLLFHIWPTVFYAGHLGVDVFFVISGFLMAKILSSAPINFRNILHFYVRRIHRIVPIYLVTLICTFTAGQSLLIQTDFQKLREDFIWSMFFASNIQSLFQSSDYFNLIFKFIIRMLLHTWSLAVEIQFYLMAPFLLLAIFWLAEKAGQNGNCVRNCCSKTARICAIFLFGIMLPSWALQTVLMLFVNGTEMLAFELVFCRLWQFGAGMVVFFLSKASQSKAKAIKQFPLPAIYCEPLGPPPEPNNSAAEMAHQQANSSPISSPTTQSNLPSSNILPPANSIESKWQPRKARQNGFIHFLWTTVTLLLTLLLIAILAVPQSWLRFGIKFAIAKIPQNSTSTAAATTNAINLGLEFEMIARTLVILIAMALIYLLRDNKNAQFSVASFLLDNPISVRFGNVSYVCYLVHWPLIECVKYYFFIDEFVIFDGLLMFSAIILLSELFDRLVDANFRRIKSKKDVLKLTIGLYVLCGMLLLPTYHSVHFENLPTNTNNIFKGKAVEANSYGQNGAAPSATFAFHLVQALNNEDGNNLGQHLSKYEKIKTNELLRVVSTMADSRLSLMEGEQYSERFSTNTTECTECKVLREVEWFGRLTERERKGKGNQTILAIGNSYLELLDHDMMIALEDYYAQFYTYAIFFCTPFGINQKFYPVKSKEFPWIYPYHVCEAFAKSAQNAIVVTQPDVLILSFRWYTSYMPPEMVTAELRAEIIGKLLEFVELAQKHVRRRIFISLPSVEFKGGNALALAKRLWLNKPLDPLNIEMQSDHIQPNQWIHDELEAANFIEKCPKCVLYDFSSVFCEKNICHYFDPKTELGYFFDECHLSLHGLRRLRPYLRELIVE